MAKERNIKNKEQHKTSRILWYLYCVFLILTFVILGKILYLQLFWEPEEETRYLSYYQPRKYMHEIEPDRGSIIDCNGKLLAYSTPMYNIHMDCEVLKSELAHKKVKVGKDSITENDWRKMASQMCNELAAIVKDGRNGEDYYDEIISYRDAGKVKSGRRNHLLVKGTADGVIILHGICPVVADDLLGRCPF